MSTWENKTYGAKVNDEAVPLVETVPAQRNFRGPDHSPTLHVQQPPGGQVVGDDVIESRCHPSNLITGGDRKPNQTNEASNQKQACIKPQVFLLKWPVKPTNNRHFRAHEKLNRKKRLPWQINRFKKKIRFFILPIPTFNVIIANIY